MDVKYHRWLELEVTHNYFPKGVSTQFKMVPLEETTRQMANYNILMNNQRNLFSLYAGLRDDADLDIGSNFQGITDLYFQLVAQDVTFFNYTDLESISEVSTYLFSNTNLSEGTSQMHTDEFVSETEFIALRPSRFDYLIPEGNVKLELRAADGTVLIKQELSNAQPSNYPVNLQHQETGVYELWLNDHLQERFLLMHRATLSGCIGVIRIQMATLISHYEEGLKYRINFQTRAVYWKYKVIVAPSRNIDVLQMEIIGFDSESYNGPVKQDFMGDQKAHVLTSAEPIQLKQQREKSPELRIQYKSTFSDQEELKIELPNAGSENVTVNFNEENEVSFYSTSIIYV